MDLYGTSPLLVGKSTNSMGRFQEQTVSLPESTCWNLACLGELRERFLRDPIQARFPSSPEIITWLDIHEYSMI